MSRLAYPRILVASRIYGEHKSTEALHDALAEEIGASLLKTGPEIFGRLGPIAAADGYDALIVAQRFPDLQAAEPIDWRGFDGIRVLHDFDVVRNYSTIVNDRYLGAWSREFRRHGFDVLICTGKEVASRMVSEGIEAYWVSKGYEPRSFSDLDRPRRGVCTYGLLYPARKAMLRAVRTSGIEVAQLQVPYARLGDRLNDFAACIVCNMDGTPRGGIVGRAVNRMMPGRLVRISRGLEPMIKNFEAAAAGCAVFADFIPELSDLGFLDGENVVFYRSLEELVEKLRAYLPEPDRLRAIGKAGVSLCARHHTWNDRARRVGEIMRELVSTRKGPSAR